MEGTQSTFEHEITDPRTDDRVRRRTAPHVNDKIDRLTQMNIEERRGAGRAAIVARLKELDREWDVDRAVMANFAILGGVTSVLGELYKGWNVFFRVQQAFLLMHAVAGWCPPLPVFRRLGFRTSKEIAAERQALTQALDDHYGAPEPAFG
jgi:hypothetical protein